MICAMYGQYIWAILHTNTGDIKDLFVYIYLYNGESDHWCIMISTAYSDWQGLQQSSYCLVVEMLEIESGIFCMQSRSSSPEPQPLPYFYATLPLNVSTFYIKQSPTSPKLNRSLLHFTNISPQFDPADWTISICQLDTLLWMK